MPQQLFSTVENNFTKGLITDTTGLNFPENAATDTDNCTYTLIGDVARREGVNFETNFGINQFNLTNKAIGSYLWKNAGGDGSSQILVQQKGNNLFFYLSSNATVAVPISSNAFANSNIDSFQSSGTATDLATNECQFADGNGYLFVYHPFCQPFYCSYVPGVAAVSMAVIDVKIRDFTGVPESIDANFRPAGLSNEHQYNLINQGWTQGNPWSASSVTTYDNSIGPKTFVVPAGIVGVVGGSTVRIIYAGGNQDFFGQTSGPLTAGTVIASGTVTSYVGVNLTLNITVINTNFPTPFLGGASATPWTIIPVSSGYITSWFTAIGNYPSNADVWWYFKTTLNVFDPTVSANTSLSSGNAPRGHFILSAFNQQKSTVSGLSITNIVTAKRPSTGAWFQGRVWYTGLDDSQAPTGDAPYYTWTENIYFSQVVNGVSDFGNCFQTNDPTSEQLFDLLPTDGGVINIQGSGKIYKLFPIQNGMLVFAANGIWFITGSQGIGFTANDYTITKISSVRSISSTSFVNVQGLPYFWNEEAIYSVTPSQQGQLTVEPLTVGTIGSFYESIPLLSKKYVRGDYNPIDYKIQWIFRSTTETDVSSRYQFDRALNYNTYNKAFFPYTFAGTVAVQSINYISSPGNISNAPAPMFKYFVSWAGGGGNRNATFADEHDENCVDFISLDGVGANYTSFFVTGYKIRGQAIKKFQPQYIQVYSRMGDISSGYKIQGQWNFSVNRNSGEWSSLQKIDIPLDVNFGTVFKRHKIRGNGFALQFKVTSQNGKPFDIQGWAVVDTVNQGT